MTVKAIPTSPTPMPSAMLFPITSIAKHIPVPSTNEEREPYTYANIFAGRFTFLSNAFNRSSLVISLGV